MLVLIALGEIGLLRRGDDLATGVSPDWGGVLRLLVSVVFLHQQPLVSSCVLVLLPRSGNVHSPTHFPTDK